MTDPKPNQLQLSVDQLSVDASQLSNQHHDYNILKRSKKNDTTEVATNQSNEILPEGNIGNITIAQHNHAPFLQKTYCMITHCDKQVAKWTDDGNMFVIMNIEKFEKEIIPQYFDHKKFSSFTRQLHLYGFRKFQNNPVTFVNENFKNDKPDLLCNIQRRTKIQVGKNQLIVEELEARVTKLNHKVDSLKSKLGQVNILKARVTSLEKFILNEGYEMESNHDTFLKEGREVYQKPCGMKNGNVKDSTIDPLNDICSIQFTEDNESFDENIFDD